MSDTFAKVQPGDPFSMQARTFNAMVDAARAHREKSLGRNAQAGRESRSSGIVLVRNDSGADQGRFAVLGVDDSIFDPTTNEEGFTDRVALAGVTPTADHSSSFVVLLEPIPSGEIGQAIVSGTVQVKVDVADEGHGFAVASTGSTASLASGSSGIAQILWKEAGTGEKWGVVLLGSPVEFPLFYKATAEQSGGTVMAERIGSEDPPEELTVCADAYPVRTDDIIFLGRDTDDAPVAMPVQGAGTALYTVPSGTDDTAETTDWDIQNQPAGYGGVLVEAWFRLYWSGTSGDSVYQFVREAKYDSKGALVYVGPEVRSEAFSTGTC